MRLLSDLQPDPDQRVLVVEDDDVNREFLERFLGSHGYRVTAVPSGEAGLAALADGGFDIVLLDLMLPGMNGGEFAWKARSLGMNAPILAVSAAMDLWDEADLRDLGVNAAIAKPFSNDGLLAQVRSLLTGALV